MVTSENGKYSEAAARLRAAYEAGAIEPLRAILAPDDAAGAYAVQRANTEFWTSAGRRVVGRKIGLTSKAVQKQLGVDQPDFGVLFSDMQVLNGGELSIARMLQPKAEAEIALVLKSELFDPEATPDDVIGATDAALAAIEIVDSRIADWRITFADTVADNGSSAFFVLGDVARDVRELDLSACEMRLALNGETVSTGSGAACLGNPLNAAAWLVRTLSRAGESLHAGDILLTGALGPMAAFGAGDRIEASIEGFGDVSFQCAAGACEQ